MTESPQYPIEFKEGSEAHYRDGLAYDRRYRHRRADVDYYVGLAQRWGGPVLELGVGTARVARRIAECGHDVVGVDGMPAMLAQARTQLGKASRRVRERVQLVQHDLRQLNLDRQFPLVLAPFNVFMHLYTRADIENALASVRRHLAPNGCLAFDVSNPDPRMLARDPTRVYRCRPVVQPRSGKRYLYREAFHYDGPSQVLHISMIMENPTDETDVQMTALSQRQFFPAELEMLLQYNGFQLMVMHGGFCGEDLCGDSESLVVEAQLNKDLLAPSLRGR